MCIYIVICSLAYVFSMWMFRKEAVTICYSYSHCWGASKCIVSSKLHASVLDFSRTSTCQFLNRGKHKFHLFQLFLLICLDNVITTLTRFLLSIRFGYLEHLSTHFTKGHISSFGIIRRLYNHLSPDVSQFKNVFLIKLR